MKNYKAKESDLPLYIKLRAELVAEFHRINGHNYNITTEMCYKIAEMDVKLEMQHSKGLIIHIEEILLLPVDVAAKLFVERKSIRIKEDLKEFIEY